MMKYHLQMFLFLVLALIVSRSTADDDLAQFVRTVMSLLREVETEMDNIRSDQRRAEFYANRVLCALRHITEKNRRNFDYQT
ncbi:hypothetical protein ABFA07_022906 [Porites harrisoni]